ncbi:MAG: hypothetical protein J2P25_08035 [Nocardiopsaceae bacterium]|nr:hypothetical protein [Nocardiopsaceae bacterium]
MSSELYRGGADRPDRPDRGDQGDQGDWSPEDDPGPDVTPVPAWADHRAPGITRAEAYAAVGQADQTPNAFLRRDAGARDEPGKVHDAQAEAGQSGADRGQHEPGGVRIWEAPAVAAAGGGDHPDPPDPPGRDSPREGRPLLPSPEGDRPPMAEASPDTRSDDDQLSPAIEQRVNAIVEQRAQEADGDVKAENVELQQHPGEARTENAEIKQQLDETNAKLDEQGAKLDAILAAVGPGAVDKATSPRETGDPDDSTGAEQPEHQSRPGDKGVITHAHSEFHGHTLDLYTDGTRWVSGDQIRAAQAEKDGKATGTGKDAQAGSERSPDTTRRGILDAPSMHDQGRNVVGERPNDADDLPPDRRQLLEADEGKRSRADRLRRRVESEEVLGNLHDTAKDQASTWQRVFDTLNAKQPQGSPGEIQNDSPHAIPVPPGHAVAGDAISAGIMAGVMLAEAGRRIHGMLARRKEVE